MTSVGDILRRESARRLQGLGALDRIALALRLGDDDVVLYRAAHNVSDREARTALSRARAIGRVPSRTHHSHGH